MVGNHLAISSIDACFWCVDLVFVGKYPGLVAFQASVCAGLVCVSFQPASYLQAATTKNFSLYFATASHLERSGHNIPGGNCYAGSGKTKDQPAMGFAGIGWVDVDFTGRDQVVQEVA